MRNQEIERELKEAQTWKTVDQKLIAEVIQLAMLILASYGTHDFNIGNKKSLSIILPHAMYNQAKIVIDLMEEIIWKGQPEEDRIAGYAFYEDVVTNHPDFFNASRKGFVKVTNEEVNKLIEILRQIKG